MLMIHSFMETVEASRIIIHMGSLQQMLHSDCCDVPSSMCPCCLIRKYLDLMDMKLKTHGEISTPAPNMDKSR